MPCAKCPLQGCCAHNVKRESRPGGIQKETEHIQEEPGAYQEDARRSLKVRTRSPEGGMGRPGGASEDPEDAQEEPRRDPEAPGSSQEGPRR